MLPCVTYNMNIIKCKKKIKNKIKKKIPGYCYVQMIISPSNAC